MTLASSKDSKPEEKTATIPIDQLTVDVYARIKLNDDRVLYWAVRFEEDPENVPPIEIAPDYSVTDGRHRLEGAILASRKDIKCHIREVKNKAEQLERAFTANLNGPLPPTKADVIMTIKEFVKLKLSRMKIMQIISRYYPGSAAIKLYDEARHGMYRDNLIKAKREVTEGNLRVPEAATKFEIDVDVLRKELGGKKKKAELTAGEMKKHLSSQYRSHGQKISTIIDKARAAHESGDFSSDEMLEIFDYMKNNTKRQARRVEEEIERLNNRKK